MIPKTFIQLREEIKADFNLRLKNKFDNGEIAGYSIVDGSQGLIINIQPITVPESININLDTIKT